jgi:hypothetical protein
MDLPSLINRMAANAEAICQLATGVGDDQARWRPAPDTWSILEVVCHLVDEEREDFRTRVDLTLHRPDAAWPPIDPVGWVTQRNYASRDLAAMLAAFQEERAGSLAWLRGLDQPNWESTHHHPRWGGFTAGRIMASWVAHDLLHLRQLVELHYLYHREHAAPYAVDYAGPW